MNRIEKYLRDQFGGPAQQISKSSQNGLTTEVDSRLHLIRQKELKPDQESLSLANGQILIRPNGGVSARVSLSSAPRIHVSSDPGAKFSGFESEEWTLLNIGTQADRFPQHVLAFGQLDFDKGHLRNNPLEILLQQRLGPEETIVALAFDGQDFRPVGEVEVENGACIIRIREIPERFKQTAPVHALVPNPFNEEDLQHSSLYDRWKIGFF